MMCFLFQAHESLAILRYELTPAVDIERGYASKSGAGGRRVCVLCLKSLEMVSLKLMSSRDLVDGLMVMCLCCWLVRHQISRDMTVK